MYLEPGLSLSRTYDLYKMEADKQKRSCVGRNVSDAVFHELDLAFYNPRRINATFVWDSKSTKLIKWITRNI